MKVKREGLRPMLATTGVVLLFKTIIPAALVAGLGLVFGVGDLRNVITGGLSGIFIGIAATLITGAYVYIGYRFILLRGIKSRSSGGTRAALAAAL